MTQPVAEVRFDRNLDVSAREGGPAIGLGDETLGAVLVNIGFPPNPVAGGTAETEVQRITSALNESDSIVAAFEASSLSEMPAPTPQAPKKTRQITAALLRSKKACADQLALFEKLGGDNLPLTEALCIEHANKFDWLWAAKNLLPPSALATYERAIEPAKVSFARAIAPARAAHDRAIAPALVAYKQAIAPHYAAYERATLPASAEYKRALTHASPQRVHPASLHRATQKRAAGRPAAKYDAANAFALAKYERAIAPVRAAYKRAIAPARETYDAAVAPMSAEYKRAIASAASVYERIRAAEFFKLWSAEG